MSSPAVPKEQLTAYQRWELDSFDTPREGAPGAASRRGGRAAILPTAEQIERMHQQAHEEGYAAGYGEGSAKVAAEQQNLRNIVAALAEESRKLDQSVADELLGLSLTISKQVLRHALALRPELVLAVVNEVLGQMPLALQRAHLMLHPEDAQLVRQSLGERLRQSGWEIIESAEISRGGCRLQAPECEVDATLESRWQRVVDAIGSGHAWIE